MRPASARRGEKSPVKPGAPACANTTAWRSRARGIGCAGLALAAALAGCTERTPSSPKEQASPAATPPPRPSAEELAARERQARLDKEFPLHGLVTGTVVKIRKLPESASNTLGWLRVGTRVRLASEPSITPDCARGFYRVHSMGYACANDGIQVTETEAESTIVVKPPARDSALPYDYYYVKEPATAEYHRLPSREEQREVGAFAQRFLELTAKDPKLGQKLLAGELKREPAKLEIVRRFIDRGFFIASTGNEARSARQFVRTVRGSFVKWSDLEPRHGSAFHGVSLDGVHEKLPIAWAVRAAQSFIPQPTEGNGLQIVNDAASKSYERLSRVPWVKRERVGDQIFHKLDDGQYLKAWYVSVADAIPRPREIKPNEPWLHVNLEQQTLVAYNGDTPVYATLVSTGLPDHDTKTGLFEIRAKHVSATMSDVGPDVSKDLRYSIDDVPWTQYFSGSIALHAAFWHAGFGLRHSHGCVNLAPLDAHFLFNHTWPELPEDWHGITTDGTGLRGSKVWITEK